MNLLTLEAVGGVLNVTGPIVLRHCFHRLKRMLSVSITVEELHFLLDYNTKLMSCRFLVLEVSDVVIKRLIVDILL